MGLMRSPQGVLGFIPDDQEGSALDNGYTRTSAADTANEASAAAPTQQGIGGAVTAGVTSALSGATLGLSDEALSQFATTGTTKDVAAAREAHPVISTVGQIGGALATGFAGEGSVIGNLPGGYLARAAGEAVDASRAVGGVRGAIGVIAASGAEGAIQNGGMYLADTALGDRDLTVEGMAGALGRGFAFGGVAGGATYGLEQGTIAARRMFARFAEGGEQAGTDAASAFDRATDQTLQAHDDTASIAQQRLDAIRAQRAQAESDRLYASSDLAQAKLARANAPQEAESALTPAASDAQGAPAPPASEPAAAPISPQSEAPIAPTRLEDQLAQMKAKVDGGSSLQDLNAERAARPPVTNPEALNPIAQEEQKLESALTTYQQKRAAVEDWLAKVKNPRTSVEADAQANVPLVRAMRSRTSKALDEDVFVEQSGGQLRTIGQGEHSLADITPNSRVLARSNAESFSRGAVLDDAYNDAIERARLAESPTAQDAALHEAADLEQQTHRYIRDTKPENGAVIDQIEKVRAASGRTGYHAAFARAERQAMDDAEVATGSKFSKADRARPRPNVALDAHEASQVLGDYEKASAELTEAVGDAAPPAAKEAAAGYRNAEDTATSKQMERTTRAIDDHVDAQSYGPEYRSPTQRIADAKQAKLEAEAKIARSKIDESEAKKAIPARSRKVAAKEPQTPALKRAVEVVPPGSMLGRAAHVAEKVGAGLELASMAGIPGVPSPHDIPVIGPLLGAYLKMRAFAGKLVGRVPATGEARAAALAAQTRNRVAQSVDRMLGLAAKSAPAAREVAVSAGGRAAEMLTKRIFDDGHPDAPKGASLTELAAVRAREAAAAAANMPEAIQQLRRELGSITDPTLLASAEQFRARQLMWIAQQAPKLPPPNPLSPMKVEPSPSEAFRFARVLAASENPVAAFELSEFQAVTPEMAATIKNVFPNVLAAAQQRLVERAAGVTQPIPYQQQARMALLFGVPIDRSFEPARIASLQLAAFATSNSPAAPTQQSSPPTPSIAGSPNLTALYETPSDRRSARR